MTTTNFFDSPENKVRVSSTGVISILCQCKTATIFPGALVETVQTDGGDSDRTYITLAAEETTTALGFVNFSLDNKKTLAENTENPGINSTFAADDWVWVDVNPNIVNAKLKGSIGSTLLPGQKMVSAGDGLLKPHPDDLAVGLTAGSDSVDQSAGGTVSGYRNDITVGMLLCRVTNSASPQRIQVMRRI